MHQSLAGSLGFPDYYGHNLDAFSDSLSDLEIPMESGLALVFRRFDAVAKRMPRVAATVLDIAEHASRRHLLFGQRLLVLVQTDDPQLELGPLGAHTVNWNAREWLLASRARPDAT